MTISQFQTKNQKTVSHLFSKVTRQRNILLNVQPSCLIFVCKVRLYIQFEGLPVLLTHLNRKYDVCSCISQSKDINPGVLSVLNRKYDVCSCISQSKDINPGVLSVLNRKYDVYSCISQSKDINPGVLSVKIAFIKVYERAAHED